MSYTIFTAVALGLWATGTCIYNACFHPLRSIPGPFFAKFSRWWLFTLEMRGNPHLDLLDLHREYGTLYYGCVAVIFLERDAIY